MENNFSCGKIKVNSKNVWIRTAVILAVLFVFWFIGLFIAPGYYRPVKFITDQQVSQYLSNYILPEIYNKSQFNQPFDIVFSQQGVNDILLRHIDVNSLKQAGFSDISIIFKRGKILLTGRTNYRGFDLILTMVLKPYIDRKGYFSAGVSKIQAGRSRLFFAVGAVKTKVFYEFAGAQNDSDISDFIVMFFNSEKIKPVFTLNHKKLRIGKIEVKNKELKVYFLPESDG